MAFISDFLAGHAEFAVFLCLGLGFLAGQIKIGTFRIGATVGTLLVSLLIGNLTAFSIPDQLKSTFFIMFTFVLGYESGPMFFSSLRSSGLKAVVLAAFYGLVTFAAVLIVCKVMGYDKGTAAGLIAGAQTQSSVLGTVKGNEASAAAATLAYAVTYIFGTAGVIFFVKKIAPALMRTDLQKAVKFHTDRAGGADLKENSVPAASLQLRAYIIGEMSSYAGRTVAEAEAAHAGLQIAKILRRGEEIPLGEECLLQSGDVIAVIGASKVLNRFDNDGLTETDDPAGLQFSLTSAELIVTAEDPSSLRAVLDQGGVLIREILRGGKPVSITERVQRGDWLKITGPEKSVRAAVRQFGYVRNTGDAADIPFFCLAIALGIIIGSFYIDLNNVPLSLGASGGALVLGLISGWIHHRHPRYCYLPGSARWFMRSMGLNLFIAVTALNAATALGAAIGWHCIPLVLSGAAVTLLPHIASVLFGHRVLKMDPVDVLGGVCGSGTCTPALNALCDDTGSTAFSASYSPAYAVGNILLTIVGIAVSLIL